MSWISICEFVIKPRRIETIARPLRIGSPAGNKKTSSRPGSRKVRPRIPDTAFELFIWPFQASRLAGFSLYFFVKQSMNFEILNDNTGWFKPMI